VFRNLECAVCGGRSFDGSPAIVYRLAAQWRLAPAEISYTDRQQGWRCTQCNSNFRSIALARAVARALGVPCPLRDNIAAAGHKRILEVNEAGNLSGLLGQMPGHVFAAYPAVDMHDMPYGDASFDVVVHSDTLEHVAQPVRALAECRRVLKPGGACCYTIPVIVGRMTITREGLPPSYHGDPNSDQEDFRVHTEYGADAWTQLFQAGFSNIMIDAVDYPSATAWTGIRA
jgi:SAM-dependent methyltransferase